MSFLRAFGWRNKGLLLLQHLHNFSNKHAVQVVVVPLFQKALVQEAAFLQILAVQLAAEKDQPGLLVVGGCLIKARRQAGGGVLIYLPAGFAAAQV